jgi:hypothetical protein
MANEKVSVDAQGKLELMAADELDRALVAPDAPKPQVPKLPERAALEQAFIEREVQREAERTVVAEASEHASSAETPESGAVTTQPPTAE